MDHAEARELIELAAAEAGGLDRLMAGDTVEAAGVAGHVAGCPDCRDELFRLRRAAATIRRVIQTTPPDDLRARTLAYVAAVGRPRGAAPPVLAGAGHAGAATGGPVAPAAADARAPVDAPGGTGAAVPAPAVGSGRRNWRPAAWVASIAAAVVIAVAATGLYLNQRITEQGLTIGGLAQTSAWTMRLSAAPGTERVELAGPGGATGTLLMSRDTDELVVTASGLANPGPGVVLRCWAEQNGERIRLGRMYFGNGLAYWSGKVENLDQIGPDATFGVSVDRGDGADGGEPILTGEL